MLNLDEKRQIVEGYIRKNPTCTYLDIKKATKLKIERLYKSMKEAYNNAGVKLSKNLSKRDREEQKQDVIGFIKQNPECGIIDISLKTQVNVERVFGGIKKAYNAAGINYVRRENWKGLVKSGKSVRWSKFEKRIFRILKNFGKVDEKVRTNSGIADCVFTYRNIDYVVEIKDFRSKNNIHRMHIVQIVRYMKALNINNGLIICHKENFPKREDGRNIYIENLAIRILSEEDLRGCTLTRLESFGGQN